MLHSEIGRIQRNDRGRRRKTVYRLQGFWEMLKFHVELYYNLAIALQKVDIVRLHKKESRKPLADELRKALLICLEPMVKERAFARFGLDRAQAKAEHVVKFLNSSEKYTAGQHLEQVALLKEIISLDFGSGMFLYVEGKDTAHFDHPDHVPESHVPVKPGEYDDFFEAGLCMMFERYTACVFHLMRVTEFHLKRLSRKLRHAKMPDPKKQKAWGSYINALRDEIDHRQLKPNKTKRDKRQIDYLSDCLLFFVGIKRTARNPTMHIEKVYTDKQALAVFDTVKVFARHVVENSPK